MEKEATRGLIRGKLPKMSERELSQVISLFSNQKGWIEGRSKKGFIETFFLGSNQTKYRFRGANQDLVRKGVNHHRITPERKTIEKDDS